MAICVVRVETLVEYGLLNIRYTVKVKVKALIEKDEFSLYNEILPLPFIMNPVI